MVNWNDIYRPKSLADIIGQDITVSIISKQIASDKLPKAYIFVGQGGTGKTSLARAIAHELGSIPIEINGAVNNTVDDIRELNEDANYMTFDGSKKIYIIDECHRINKAGWGASLKLLEEPPENVLFIFCTTELDKLPKTILSRAQVFYLQPVSPEKIQERLGIICTDNKINFEPKALEYIAKNSMGCFREAIQKLEQISVLGDVTFEAVKKILPDMDLFSKILIDRDFSKIDELAQNSVSIDSLIKEAIDLAIDGKFPKGVAIGLVKLRPHLNTPFDPKIVRVYLEGALGGENNG